MKCPACTTGGLQPPTTEELPHRLTCGHCGGQWIKGHQYWKWLAVHGENLPERVSAGDEQPSVQDSARAKLCPDCGRYMRRAKVGHGVNFYIERCGACGGIWLDRNEWEVLKARNLHDDLHFIFSSAWQHDVCAEEQREAYEQRIAALLGAEDFARLRDFKAWAQSHARRATIMAYLADLEA